LSEYFQAGEGISVNILNEKEEKFNEKKGEIQNDNNCNSYIGSSACSGDGRSNALYCRRT
jgi:hypothetical protein